MQSRISREGSIAALSSDERVVETIDDADAIASSSGNQSKSGSKQLIDRTPKSATKVNFGSKSKYKENVDPEQEKLLIDPKTEQAKDIVEPKQAKNIVGLKESVLVSILSKSNVECKDERRNWWKDPEIKYAFNLPTVRANLGRLIGTDEVIINNHQFMMNLRASISNDFDEKLTGKVKQREAMEIERTKKLILKCQYNQYNCPRKLRPLHSDVLAFDLQNEPNEIEKPLKAEAPSQYDGPVFNINKKTNVTINLRRKKIKTIRKTNFEYLMREVLKDFQWSENLGYNETRAVQDKLRPIHEKKHPKHFSFISKMVSKVKSLLQHKNTKNK